MNGFIMHIGHRNCIDIDFTMKRRRSFNELASQFLDDLGIAHGWNPRGWYKRIQSHRFQGFGGVQKYVEHLRKDFGFTPLP